LLLGLVAILIINVHGKWTAGPAYLRLPTQISYLLSTGLVMRILSLGFGLLLLLPLLPPFVHAMPWSMVEYYGKTSQAFDRQAVGCSNLVVLKSTDSKAKCKIQAPIPVLPCE
jgi:hypothetical protein